jgi:hypothetical protein
VVNRRGGAGGGTMAPAPAGPASNSTARFEGCAVTAAHPVFISNARDYRMKVMPGQDENENRFHLNQEDTTTVAAPNCVW